MAIIISSPKYLPNEADAVNSLFENGMNIFHLRKPNSNYFELEELLAKINPDFYSRITIHYYFKFVNKFNIGGVHFSLNSFTPKIITQFIGKRISVSCHTLDEIINLRFNFDYVFLSPIFESISKKNYKSKFVFAELKKSLAKEKQNKVIALGGITPQNQPQAKAIGFAETAVLGYLWNKYKGKDSIPKLIEKFGELK